MHHLGKVHPIRLRLRSAGSLSADQNATLDGGYPGKICRNVGASPWESGPAWSPTTTRLMREGLTH